MSELVLCVPGCWKDRAELLARIITVEPAGRYMFAGGILTDLHEKEHVMLEVRDADPDLARAFGGKHHTTVISAVQKIAERLKDDASLRSEIHAIEAMVLR